MNGWLKTEKILIAIIGVQALINFILIIIFINLLVSK